MIADSPGRGFALLTPFTTHASGSMSAAIAGDGALGQREHGVGRGLDERRERAVAEHAERSHVLAARRASRPAWAADAAFRIRIDDHPLADRERRRPARHGR